MYLSLFITSVMLVTLLLTLWVKRKFTIEVNVWAYRTINNTHKVVKRICLFFAIVCITGLFISNYYEFFGIILMIVVIFSLIYDTYVEYKYEREEKDYLISLVHTISALVISIGVFSYFYTTLTFDDINADAASINSESINPIEIIHYQVNENADNILDRLMRRRTITLENEQDMNELIIKLKDLELRRGFTNSDDQYFYSFRFSYGYNTHQNISVYKQHISIESQLYKVIGDNTLYEKLEDGHFD